MRVLSEVNSSENPSQSMGESSGPQFSVNMDPSADDSRGLERSVTGGKKKKKKKKKKVEQQPNQ